MLFFLVFCQKTDAIRTILTFQKNHFFEKIFLPLLLVSQQQT